MQIFLYFLSKSKIYLLIYKKITIFVPQKGKEIFMNRLIIILLTAFQSIVLSAQKQPKWVEKASKAVVTVETLTKDGVKKSCNGFFISEKGEVVSAYEVFRGSVSAVVITAAGERLNVTQILGADDMYGVVRFKVTPQKKLEHLKVATTRPVSGDLAFLLPSKEEKILSQGSISDVSKIKNTFDYYRIDRPLPLSQENFPLLNSEGEVFAISQPDNSQKGNTYGVDLAYVLSLQVSTSDLFKRAYAEIGIRKGWATDFEDARLALILYASQQDANTYLETLNDFVESFPDNPESYFSRATHYSLHRNELGDMPNRMLDLAMDDLDLAVKLSKDKAEGLYNKAKTIFTVAISDTSLVYKDWNIATAEDYLQKALKENPRPDYYLLAGNIAFQRLDFDQAYKDYSIVNQSNAATGRSFFLAAKCKQQIKGSNPFEIITLLDSAAAKSPDAEAAAYVLELAEIKTELGLFADVVKDYDRYYLMTAGKVNDAFYYFREQAKYRSDDFEGALKDIDRAITASDGKNAVYFAEKASVYLRLKDLLKAQQNAEQAIALQNDFAAAYRILGISFMRQQKKTEACNSFNKAKELGDVVAERLVTDNCN
jgi:tetratricopeptide (TPR) repeat protein